jgi:Flp pilus assembly protein TadB
LASAGSPAALASATALKAEKQKRIEEVDTRLKELEPTAAELVSQGFLRDLLSDGRQYSFHRFQIVAWTLVLGVIFVASVYEGLRMPEFNSTLLGLMGLSAGAYVSLKFPEK